MSYDKQTGYETNSNVIRIKMRFSREYFECMNATARECYHVYDIYCNNPNFNYDVNDRKIENACSEYELNYGFEKDAEVFYYHFANFY